MLEQFSVEELKELPVEELLDAFETCYENYHEVCTESDYADLTPAGKEKVYSEYNNSRNEIISRCTPISAIVVQYTDFFIDDGSSSENLKHDAGYFVYKFTDIDLAKEFIKKAYDDAITMYDEISKRDPINTSLDEDWTFIDETSTQCMVTINTVTKNKEGDDVDVIIMIRLNSLEIKDEMSPVDCKNQRWDRAKIWKDCFNEEYKKENKSDEDNVQA